MATWADIQQNMPTAPPNPDMGDYTHTAVIPGIGTVSYVWEDNAWKPKTTAGGNGQETWLTPGPNGEVQGIPQASGDSSLWGALKALAPAAIVGLGGPALGAGLASLTSAVPAAGAAAETAGAAGAGGAAGDLGGGFSGLVSSAGAPAAGAGAGTGLGADLASAGMAGGGAASTGLTLPGSLGGTATGLGLDSAAAGAGMNAGISAASPDLGSMLGPVTAGLTPAGVASGATDLTVPGVATGTEPGTVGAPSLIGPGAGGLLNTSGLGANDVGLTPGTSVPGVGTPPVAGTPPAGTPPGGGSGAGWAGITSLLPYLGLAAAAMKKPNEDTSQLTDLANQLRAKAATEKPDTSGLTNLADQFKAKAGTEAPDTSAMEALATKLGGAGSTADLLTAQAKDLIPSLSSGSLPAGAQATVQNALNDELNGIKSKYASMGLSGSTMENQEIAAAKNRSLAASFSLSQQMTATGLQEAQQASANYQAAANVQNAIQNAKMTGSQLSSQDLAQAANLISQSVTLGLQGSSLATTDFADSAAIFQHITDIQLQEDASLQTALANFASASALGVGLAAQGGGGSGATGFISSIGSGITSGWDSLMNSLGIGKTATA